MDPGFLLIENFGRFVAIAGMLMSAPLFAWAGWQYMSSMGDPNKSASARNSVICVCVGIIIIGGSFIVPGIISDAIVEPVGGVTFDVDGSINCDQILRDHLVVNKEASNGARINFVIRRIQAQFDGCGPHNWSPEVRTNQPGWSECFDSSSRDSIAGVPIPASLDWRKNSIVNSTGRDEWGNIIVHWGPYLSADPPFGHPSDSSYCWLYIGSVGDWIEGY